MMEKKKILIIDDEEDFSFFVQKNLEATGEFEVITANRGEEGINLAKKKQPDLILLDIFMPRLSGPDVAEILNNDPNTKEIPLIFLTALVAPGEMGVESTKEIGGRLFIAKPVDTERLVSSIRMILGSKRA
jgi:CheY-like chemotaxis protein